MGALKLGGTWLKDKSRCKIFIGRCTVASENTFSDEYKYENKELLSRYTLTAREHRSDLILQKSNLSISVVNCMQEDIVKKM